MSESMLEIYANGLICCSVCTDLKTKKAIEDEVNKQNPTELSSKWKISKDKTFASGQPMPYVCKDNSSRKHYLLNC